MSLQMLSLELRPFNELRLFSEDIEEIKKFPRDANLVTT